MFVKRWGRAAFAAQWMAPLASDSDAGLDALPDSDSDDSVGAAKALDVLDALVPLVASARPPKNSGRTKVARKVKAALAARRKKETPKKEALAKPHGRSDGERQPEYALFTMIDSEKNISVKFALDVSFGKFAHISDSFLCGQYDLSFEMLEKIRRTTMFRYLRNRYEAYEKLMDTKVSAAHFAFLCA